MTQPLRSTRRPGQAAASFAAAAAALLALSGQARAQSQDAVLVLWHGGVDRLGLLDVRERLGAASAGADPGQPAPWEVVDQGQVRLFEGSPQTIEDVRVLPDGRLLLTGINKKRVLVVNPDDLTQQLVYDPQNTFAQLETAAVVTYGAFGAPTRVLIADSQPSLLSIYDVEQRAIVRREGLFLPNAKAFFAQAILLPEGRLAVATNWRSAQVSGIDLIDLTPGPERPARVRLANVAHEGQPAQTLIAPALSDLRDLMGLDAQTLLVATRHSVLAVTRQGQLLWTLELSSLGGEVASARVTPSGRLVVATFEPGQWTSPHVNHRVHWFAWPTAPEEAPTWLASSGPLERAPKRVEPWSSTGGTGTLNYRAGLQDLEAGQLSELTLQTPLTLSADTLGAQDAISASVTWLNPSPRAVAAWRAAIVATRGERCDDPQQPLQVLAQQEALLFEPGQTRALTATLRAQAPLSPGRWCVQAALRADQGPWLTFAPELALTVLDDQGQSKPRLPSRDLNLRQPGQAQDMGQDQDQGGQRPSTPEASEGCACAQLGGRGAGEPGRRGELVALLALGLGLLRTTRPARGV